MKKTFLLGALLLHMLPGFGCDQCSCGLLPGIQPFDRADHFALQYRLRYLHGELLVPTSPLMKHGGHGTTTSTAPASVPYTEIYQVMEARALFWLNARLSVVASVPLVNNYGDADHVRYADLYAVGDPQVLLRHLLIREKPDGGQRLRHRLFIGAGVKPPLAASHTAQYGQELDHDLQPGTGTWDMLFSTEYMVRGPRLGASLSAVARINGTNDEDHRMGHGFSGTLELFRAFTFGPFQWSPSAGGYAEHALPDMASGERVDGTGTSVLFTHLGSRVWWRSFGLSIAWQHAVLEDRGPMMIPNRERFTAGLTYNFNEH